MPELSLAAEAATRSQANDTLAASIEQTADNVGNPDQGDAMGFVAEQERNFTHTHSNGSVESATNVGEAMKVCSYLGGLSIKEATDRLETAHRYSEAKKEVEKDPNKTIDLAKIFPSLATNRAAPSEKPSDKTNDQSEVSAAPFTIVEELPVSATEAVAQDDQSDTKEPHAETFSSETNTAQQHIENVAVYQEEPATTVEPRIDNVHIIERLTRNVTNVDREMREENLPVSFTETVTVQSFQTSSSDTHTAEAVFTPELFPEAHEQKANVMLDNAVYPASFREKAEDLLTDSDSQVPDNQTRDFEVHIIDEAEQQTGPQVAEYFNAEIDLEYEAERESTISEYATELSALFQKDREDDELPNPPTHDSIELHEDAFIWSTQDSTEDKKHFFSEPLFAYTSLKIEVPGAEIEPIIVEAVSRLMETAAAQAETVGQPELTEEMVEDIITILEYLGHDEPRKVLRAYAKSHNLTELFAAIEQFLPEFSKLIDYQQHLLQALGRAQTRSDRRQAIAQSLSGILLGSTKLAVHAA